MQAYFDGSHNRYDSKCGVAYILGAKDSDHRVAFARAVKFLSTSQKAEMVALVELLKTLNRLKVKEVKIYGDDQTLITKVNTHLFNFSKRGDYDRTIKDIWKEKFPFLMTKIFQEITRIPHVTLQWIPREENEEADGLAKKASGMEAGHRVAQVYA